MAASSRRARALAGALVLSAGGMLPVALTGALAVQLQAALDVGDAWIGASVSLFFLGGGLLAVTVSHRVDNRA